ncbi:MAG TPA: helix-turn-helix domain-containing protein [Thermoanaerobaculia bacterium]|nr:helix-turn-helix domain-containing protein [Thermoanaerobaculia bacterium]
MGILHRTPAPPLSDFVALLWLYETDRPSHEKELALPSGAAELVVNLREDETRLYDAGDAERCMRLPGAVVCGPQSEYFVIDTEEQIATAGVHFKAGGIFPFVEPPSHEIAERHTALEDLWGRADARRLRLQLLEAPTPEEKLDALERELLARLRRGPERHPAVAHALGKFRRVPHLQTIADVTREIGLSPRRFIEVFKEEVGLAPKAFCRVRRFQRVLTSIYERESVEWADVAVACGYYDQAHLIHDFRAFSGINPTAYMERRGRHRNHVAI